MVSGTEKWTTEGEGKDRFSGSWETAEYGELEAMLEGVDFSGKRVYVIPSGGNVVPMPSGERI